MTAYVIAVSGGVDSVVLLDMWAKQHHNSIVAHFDHGIRPDSAADAQFVQELAQKYGLAFELRREELGKGASEQLARERRYAFLRSVAARYKAPIATAHHADDIVETVAINMQRGTGWRGLAVLDSPDIIRPLLHMTKKDILAYATNHGLTWHEDSTNNDLQYMRNRWRGRLATADAEAKQWICQLRQRQVVLKQAIDQETQRLVGQGPYSRYFFTHCGDVAAIELLRMVFTNEKGYSPTIPQRQRALQAIKVARAGTHCEVALGVTLQFTASNFIVV